MKTDDNGTTFELYFPITRDEIWKKENPLSIETYKANGEMILVVDDYDDDEESQREISRKILDTLGYKTKAFSSGEEAVAFFKENTVDLLLLDMIIAPGINGRETYEKIIKIHPNQKAIIVSANPFVGAYGIRPFEVEQPLCVRKTMGECHSPLWVQIHNE